MSNVAKINTSIVYEPSQTTHWKNLFPSKMMLLGSQNLNQGEELVAKIRHVEIQQIKSSTGKGDNVPVVTFENAPPMALNITNARTISGLYGESYDGWRGQSIQLYVTGVKGYGTKEMVNGLRIRNTIPSTPEDAQSHTASLENCATLKELQQAFTAIPKHLKPNLIGLKDTLKQKLGAINVQG